MIYTDLVMSLGAYVSSDDSALDRLTFLEFVRDRIADDIVRMRSLSTYKTTSDEDLPKCSNAGTYSW